MCHDFEEWNNLINLITSLTKSVGNTQLANYTRQPHGFHVSNPLVCDRPEEGGLRRLSQLLFYEFYFYINLSYNKDQICVLRMCVFILESENKLLNVITSRTKSGQKVSEIDVRVGPCMLHV